jgi:hypothetical protein
MCYIGLDVRKRLISYCVKEIGGAIHAEGTAHARCFDLDRPTKTLPGPGVAALKVTRMPKLCIQWDRSQKSKRASPETSELTACSRFVVTLLDVRGVVFFGRLRFQANLRKIGAVELLVQGWNIGAH